MPRLGEERRYVTGRAPPRTVEDPREEPDAGTTDEVAGLVLWLCSEECSFNTGAIFDLSGGRGDLVMWRQAGLLPLDRHSGPGLLALPFRPARKHVQTLDQCGKGHRSVDVALRNAGAKAFRDQRHTDHQQEAEGEHD
jgi:hypothetical protein